MVKKRMLKTHDLQIILIPKQMRNCWFILALCGRSGSLQKQCRKDLHHQAIFAVTEKCCSKKRKYSETSLSQTRWVCIKTLKYLSIRDIECTILKNKWWGLTNHFDLSIVLKISVFDISKFNCISSLQKSPLIKIKQYNILNV